MITKSKYPSMNNYIFESQFKQEIIFQADKLGVRIAASKSFNDVLVDFLTVRLKLIDIIPRDAIMSPPLLNKLFFHTHKKEIETIFKYAKTGQNLNQFQSKRILQSRFHDHLSNEWNIYHFHLSLKRDLKSSFVKQVDMLLFAYIENKKIIFSGNFSFYNLLLTFSLNILFIFIYAIFCKKNAQRS